MPPLYSPAPGTVPAWSLVLRAPAASSCTEWSHGTAHYSNEYVAPPLWEWSRVYIHYCNERYHVTTQYRKKLQAPGEPGPEGEFPLLQTLGTIRIPSDTWCPIDLYWYRVSVSAISDIFRVSADTIRYRYFQVSDGNLLPLGKEVQWGEGFGLVERMVKAEKEVKTSDFIFPVFVCSVRKEFINVEKEDLKLLFQTAQKLTGVVPIVVLTHKTAGSLTKTEGIFRDLGIDRIFSFENYTREDHMKTRGKHEEVLKFLCEVIKDVQFRVEQPRDPSEEMMTRRIFVLKYIHECDIKEQQRKVEKKKATEQVLQEKRHKQQEEEMKKQREEEERQQEEEFKRHQQELRREREHEQARQEEDIRDQRERQEKKKKTILGKKFSKKKIINKDSRVGLSDFSFYRIGSGFTKPDFFKSRVE
ncbi:unnamed protein product [Ranitomeya imitator]|uniref:Uncharacterized protein n=1 Tax=Ranitomeya imitator TaxID=111125 RepID=A0ABN9LTL1_9NEOB|nr:unnamed protein product [Ranitomeya imitator]